MASLRILIKELIEDFILQEIGEANIEPFQYSKLSDVKYSFDFDIKKDILMLKLILKN